MSQPDLTKTIGMSSMEAQDQRVETEILEPSAFSQQQVKFLFPQKGLLSSDAFLSFKVTAPNGTQDLCLTAGSLGLISRAALYYDNILLAETDQAGALLNMKQYFIDQDIRNNTYATKTGGITGLKVDQSAAGKRGMFMLDAPRPGAASYNSGLTALQTVVDANGSVQSRSGSFRLGTTADDTPEWTIPLKWLFNFLSQIQLPLGLLNGRISCEITFSEDLRGVRSVINQANPNVGVPWVAGTNVVEESCKLALDLIYYDDQPGKPSPMDRIQSTLEKGIELVYTDYIHIEEFIPGLANAPAGVQKQNKVCRLNLDHQIIRNILIATPIQANYNQAGKQNFSNPILGDYNSQASRGDRTLQVKINNQTLYVNALDMDCKLYNELSQTMNTPFKANVGLTSLVGQCLAPNLNYNLDQVAFPDDKFIFGHIAGSVDLVNGGATTMTGSAGFMGVNLSRTYDNVLGAGTSVGKAPVEVELTYDYCPQDFKQRRVLMWVEAERMMMIKNGTIYVSGS